MEKPLAGLIVWLMLALSNTSAPTPTHEPTVQPIATETPNPTKKPKKYRIVDMGTFMITAYCPCYKCCGDHANGITATGTKAKQGRTIAVDPNVIPYGTKVKFNGHWYIAEDCGGKIKNKHIDLYFSKHSDADNWGIKYKKVKIKVKIKKK